MAKIITNIPNSGIVDAPLDNLQYGRQNGSWTEINTPDDYTKIVYVNSANPSTATIFDTNNPPLINNNLLKNDIDNLYIGTDSSTWVYKTSPAGYSTKSISTNTSNFYLDGTTTDAGGTKTANIKRTGRVGGGNAIDVDDFVTKQQLDAKEPIVTAGTISEYYRGDKTWQTLPIIDLSGKQDTLTETNFGAFENSLSAKATPIDADSISIVDTADLNKQKKVSLTNFKAYLLTWITGLFVRKDRLLENATVSGTYALDYSSYEIWNLTLTGTTTFSESNLEPKTILIRCTGNFALTFPAGWSTGITGAYIGTVSNTIVLQYFKTGLYKVSIIQPD